ncbi:YqgE/AlgH family protein [Rhizobium tarimense]|nr:YqgE/AlgH family protein [Pseudorhizobium tarimense]
MPGLQDGNFARSVIYICAHSPAGAMGFIINRHQPVSFLDVLDHLDMLDDDNEASKGIDLRGFPVLMGGPVETGRGFVLHSDDYSGESSIPVTDDVCLTATLDIIRAISQGKGPRRATMMLGYAGWGPGQLEVEIANNGWLNCPSCQDLIYDPNVDTKYERALALLGITPEALSTEAGHA